MPDPTNESILKNLKEQLSRIQEEIGKMEGSSSPATLENPVVGAKEQDGKQKKAEDLLIWRAPSRIFRPRSKKWFANIGLMVLILAVLLLFMREFLLIGVLIALAFVIYVLATVPPDEIENKITDQGVITGGHEYLWSELVDFWFSQKYGEAILNIDLKFGFPGRLTLLFNSEQQDKIKQILSRYLPFREIPKTNWWEKMTEGVVDRVPMEKSQSEAAPVFKEIP